MSFKTKRTSVILLLLFALTAGCGQNCKLTVRFKAALFSNIIGEIYPRGLYFAPRIDKKGRIAFYLYFDSSLNKTNSVDDRNKLADLYTRFICDFVLADSLQYYDSLRFSFLIDKENPIASKAI